MQEIMVSVICNAYNHEKYIRNTLEGFVMQKTNFRFEVLIHDDASLDKTPDIIREYEKMYPDIIKPIYQTENQFSQNIPIGKLYQHPRVKGKYIAYCEGDDCWIDEGKLQKQFDFMEENTNCTMICHNSKRVDHETGKITVENVIGKTGYISPEDIIIGKIGSWIATASIFVRKEIILEMPDFNTLSSVGDYTIRMMALAKGDVYYSNEVMSVYNYKVPGSWSSGAWKTINRPGKNNLEYLKQYNEYTDYKYNDLVQRATNQILFSKYVNEYELKKLKSEEMREFYKQLSIKKKMKIYIAYYIPFVLKVRELLKKKH